MGFGENVVKKQKGTVDRISELPEFILHNILSMLDTKEAGRASVLSKRWYDVWSSIPVLDFRYQYFKGDWDKLKYDFNGYYDTDTVQSYIGFIDRTMQRYFTERYRIMKLNLEFPMVDDEKIDPLVDQWFEIAVQNQIEELEFKILYERTQGYRLPEILLRAKSLKVLKCANVVLPYYETMELISLEYLSLNLEAVDIDLLQRIISFSPLVELDITVSYLGRLSLPWTRKVNETKEFVGNGIMQSNFKASPLRKLAYNGRGTLPWPWNMNVIALKNLRKLEFVCAMITDDIVSQLARELVVLEKLVLSECPDLTCIDISSISLKKLQIIEGLDVMKVIVDAPNLLEFQYNCEVKTALLLTSALDHCNAQFVPFVVDGEDTITTDWFVKLKKTLFETNFFKSLVIDLSTSLEIEVEEEQLMNLVTGPSYKLRELKLREASPDSINSSIEAFLRQTSNWKYTESSLPAFLDGLFWCCHPDVLSITTNLYNLTAKSILNILKRKVHCYKHPLRSIEVETVDSSSFLSEPSEFEIRFRLSWF